MAAQRQQGEGNKTRSRRKLNANESAGRRTDTEVKAPSTDAARLSFSKAETRRRNWLETIDNNRFLTVPCLATEEGLVGLQFLTSSDATSQDWDQLSADGDDNTGSDDSGNSMDLKNGVARSTQSQAK